ncbi:hypothetical protein BB561_001992 [Smittium simulii]|uniref:Clu domain-containing protein n=1 Tax=Smittium simulii TaxID=133385 RepID=A0A2T9YS54_9FUNG|nr:hypothetical protein BB561_001992 [Smittium simulii]
MSTPNNSDNYNNLQQNVASDTLDNQNSEKPTSTEDHVHELTNFSVQILAPNGAKINLNLTGSELIQELKQVIAQSPETIEYTCFDLHFNGQALTNHSAVSDIISSKDQSVDTTTPETSEQQGNLVSTIVLELKKKNYTEREIRVHISRLRDLLSGPQQKLDNIIGIDTGATIFPIINNKISSKAVQKKKASLKKTVSTSVANGVSASISKKGSSKDKKATQKLQASKISSFTAPTPLTVLSTQPWRSRIKPDLCLKQLILSGWNPVSPHRYLKGDLLYLELATLENITYYITASLAGFFVNKSTGSNFDPNPVDPPKKSHSLISLVRKLSPRFTKNFENLQASYSSLYPLETISINSCTQVVAPWIVSPIDDLNSANNHKNKENIYDLINTQQNYIKYGPRATDAIRDWNEELQTIKEIDTSTLNDYEGALKDNQLLVWQNEFTEAAITGAMAVVDDEVLPLNPTELPSQYIYLRENIFFSKANDSRDTFADLGGDSAAIVAASKDLQGVQILNGLETKDVFQLGTVLIDYRGNRIIAQTVVPGILRTENENPVIYGSVDNGSTIKSDPDFHNLIEPIASQLKLKEHSLKDTEGNLHKLYTSVDIKGLKGTDGRKYLVDLYRLFPVDSEFFESDLNKTKDLGSYPHKMALIRNELLSLYWENCIRNHVKKIIAKRQESKKNLSESDAQKEVSGDNDSKISNDESEELYNQEIIAASNEELDSDVLLNQDVFVPINLSEKNKEFNEAVFASDKEAVVNVSKFLNNNVIPNFVNELIVANLAPITGRSLTRHMHNRGINVRYLGKLAQLLPKDTKSTYAVYSLIVREMITRSMKHIFRSLFMAIESRILHPSIFAYTINNLFGINCDGISEFDGLSSMIQNSGIDFDILDIAGAIRKKVATLYRYKLDDDWVKQYVMPNKRIILREICLKVGVQIVLRNYDSLFSIKSGQADANIIETNSATLPYLSSIDILNFVPLVRVAGSPVPMPSATLDYGRSMIAEGKKELGLGLIHNLCLLHEQKCGNVHPSTASCYSDLATCYHELKEHSTAIDLMHQAIISNERSSGLDDTETIYNYLNLAMFEHSNDNYEASIQLINHALDLWKLVGTMDHPILSVIYSNIAAMHQKYAFESNNQLDNNASQRLNSAVQFFELSTNLREKLYGVENVLTATSMLNLGKALASNGDLKVSIDKIMVAYTSFKNLIGEEDPRTIDAKQWLDKVTGLAIDNAQNAQIATATKILANAHEKFVASAPKGSQDKKISLEQYNKMLTEGIISLELDGKNSVNTVRNKKDIKNMDIDDIYSFVVGSKKNKNKTSKKQQTSSKPIPKNKN